MKAPDFTVLQPGSSVATALSEGESRPKHVQILEVLGSNYRLVKLPLLTVRPFVFSHVRIQQLFAFTCLFYTCNAALGIPFRKGWECSSISVP